MAETNILSQIDLDDRGLPAPTPEIDQERKVAIFDLLEKNEFAIVGRDGQAAPAGPYHLHLAIKDRRLVFTITAEAGEEAGQFLLSLSPFRQVVKDYFQICASYFNAVKHMPPAQIEALDMGRRGIHNEGGRVVQERLEGKVDTDLDTARRLFTLICVLHFKG